LIEGEPSVESLVARIPGEGRVIRVARGDDAAGFDDAAHFLQRCGRIGEVLQHLMRVDDVP
jgi:hypothetical protein